MNKLLFVLLILILLNACQTHFPVISEDLESTEVNTSVVCTEKTRGVSADYLLYANKMIDSMVQSDVVNKMTINRRMSLYLSPVQQDNHQLDTVRLNQVIKNRVLRSGLFLIAANSGSANYQLSGQIEDTKKRLEDCYEKQTVFNLKLKKRGSDKILWSETRYLN